jgi:protein-disulfide isomerase/uncharacterized membrane protein/rhodanese-related sulfurtransferase
MVARKSLTLALSLLGLFDSLYLLYTYTSPSRPMVCIGTGCDAVRASVYSSLWGVSMPVFGVFGYGLLAIFIVAESLFPGRLARWARYALLGMTGLGFLFSLYLEYLQAFAIHAYCAWCVTSGFVMTALFALAVVNVIRAGPEPDPAMQLVRVRSLFAVSVAGLLAGLPAFYLLVRHSELAPQTHHAAPADLAQRLARPGSHTTGNPQARLTVVEFGDFECPVCGRGEAAARVIRTQYADQVRFIFRQFPLERIHPLAEKAAEASECAAEQGKFWEMVEKIYSRQSDLSAEGLKRDAAEVGLNQSRFNECLTGGAMASRVHADIEDARALGVRATPTFFIGEQRVEGVLSVKQFSQLVAEQLSNAGVNIAGVASAQSEVATIPEKPVTKPATQNMGHAAPTQPSRGIAKANADSLQASTGGLPGASPGGFIPGLHTSAPGGPFGVLQAGAGGGTCSEADAAKTQPTLIHTPELRQLLSGDARPLFVDVRSAGDYAAARIPGAISLPADEIERRWNTLPKDRVIVIYESGRSSGDICAASRAVGRALLEHGFPFAQVKVYQDGLVGWERAGIDIRK